MNDSNTSVSLELHQEIQQNLNFRYVFGKTWLVFACGVAYLVYAIACSMTDAVAPRHAASVGACEMGFQYDTSCDGLTQVYLLIVSWVLYPFTTYWMCLPVPENCKKSFLWKWVMDVKRNQG